jgi:hypothetical protein
LNFAFYLLILESTDLPSVVVFGSLINAGDVDPDPVGSETFLQDPDSDLEKII